MSNTQSWTTTCTVCLGMMQYGVRSTSSPAKNNNNGLDLIKALKPTSSLRKCKG